MCLVCCWRRDPHFVSGSKTFTILATKPVNQQVLVFVLFDRATAFLVILNFQDNGRFIKVFHMASYSQYQAHIIRIFQER